MGNIDSIHVHPSCPSPTCPGELSCISDPIGHDMVDDIDEFFHELVACIRDPVNEMDLFWLKDVDLQEMTVDDFTVRKVYDGKKIHKFDPQLPEEDRCDFWMHGLIDRKHYHITTRTHQRSGDEVTMHEHHTVFLPNKVEGNFRIEVWRISSKGTRKAGWNDAAMVEYVYLKPLLACRFNLKVKVRSSIHMHESGGISALTDPLDEFLTPSELFEGIVRSHRDVVKSRSGTEEAKSDDEFDSLFTLAFPMPQRDQGANEKSGASQEVQLHSRIHAVLDRENLQVVMHEYCMEELVNMHFWRVHADPVRCEHWTVYPSGIRNGGGKQACRLRVLLMKLISEAEIAAEVEEIQPNKQFMF